MYMCEMENNIFAIGIYIYIYLYIHIRNETFENNEKLQTDVHGFADHVVRAEMFIRFEFDGVDNIYFFVK